MKLDPLFENGLNTEWRYTTQDVLGKIIQYWRSAWVVISDRASQGEHFYLFDLRGARIGVFDSLDEAKNYAVKYRSKIESYY